MSKSIAGSGLAGAFSRTGWIGFWMQIAICLISSALTVYIFVLDRDPSLATRGGLTLVKYLTVASLLVLTFTTIWSYRYTVLAGRISDPGRRPSASSVRRTAGVGVAASMIGVVLSMLIMSFEVIQLFLHFLRAPKAGVPVVQTTGGPATWVSAGDILNLAVIILITFVEIIVLSFSLWLLFRASITSAEYPCPQTSE
ncbi:hypothetical protein FHX15_005834 [Rhizobium sp. BK650]|uniref:DUF3611 family protein n=1 Tax=Rhizobium sp. BK650 TaxID=2586990 RepID=UPI00160A31B3|nr:DUF3611 family protein [Rhizobium sp. BK650]MBB3660563.1 hypothetical protein [Rhizobium sp. BK650]